jgi:tRNA-splicing ligase RtcB
MKKIPFKRIQQKLLKSGLNIDRENNNVLSIKSVNDANLESKILLPENFAIEEKAIHQLMDFARIQHPDGGHVKCSCATPDFHTGSTIPVGSVVVTSHDMVIPQAIGTDINCGMRLHKLDLTYDKFMANKDVWVKKLKGDLLEGTRNIPVTPHAMKALFDNGVGDFFEVMNKSKKEGIFDKIDYLQIENELSRLHTSAFEKGNSNYAPEALQNMSRDLLRDPSMGTLGGGNHFCELQVITEITDRQKAYEYGLKVGQLVVMIHTGSRDVGFYVGSRWADKAKQQWPVGHKHPDSKIFPVLGELADEYLMAMHSAAHYATLNRALIAELVRQRTKEVFGDLDCPLVVDVPHNIVLKEAIGNVHRKGATPAYAGQDLLIPGSMGHDSYLLSGLGNESWLSSASHGAGRSISRNEISFKARKDKSILGLDKVECITLKEERMIEEAPAAYKEIGPVIQSQVDEKTVSVIAKFSPILTFKA